MKEISVLDSDFNPHWNPYSYFIRLLFCCLNSRFVLMSPFVRNSSPFLKLWRWGRWVANCIASSREGWSLVIHTLNKHMGLCMFSALSWVWLEMERYNLCLAVFSRKEMRNSSLPKKESLSKVERWIQNFPTGDVKAVVLTVNSELLKKYIALYQLLQGWVLGTHQSPWLKGGEILWFGEEKRSSDLDLQQWEG